MFYFSPCVTTILLSLQTNQEIYFSSPVKIVWAYVIFCLSEDPLYCLTIVAGEGDEEK